MKGNTKFLIIVIFFITVALAGTAVWLGWKLSQEAEVEELPVTGDCSGISLSCPASWTPVGSPYCETGGTCTCKLQCTKDGQNWWMDYGDSYDCCGGTTSQTTQPPTTSQPPGGNCTVGANCPASTCEYPDVAFCQHPSGQCGANQGTCTCQRPRQSDPWCNGTICASLSNVGTCNPGSCPSHLPIRCGTSVDCQGPCQGCTAVGSCSTSCSGCNNKTTIKLYCRAEQTTTTRTTTTTTRTTTTTTPGTTTTTTPWTTTTTTPWTTTSTTSSTTTTLTTYLTTTTPGTLPVTGLFDIEDTDRVALFAIILIFLGITTFGLSVSTKAFEPLYDKLGKLLSESPKAAKKRRAKEKLEQEFTKK